ncbi:hypothetical protein Ahy_A07g035798 [Arachis hypogaea]|uniref:Uncharacterized protein n=1 Tax=Arachis hypogaea TaxID=3818 RepID=A0A445CEQ3_ARAHY|nr:hypothetical protein Ahy_A07g035798 [Arachis hypogaea]
MTPKKKRATPKKKTVTPAKEKVNNDDGLSPKTKKKNNKRYVGRTRRYILDRDEAVNGLRQGKPEFYEFDDVTSYGEVDFEVGEMFDTVAQFKQPLKDMFVFEGKELEYIKNKKHRVGAKCVEEGYSWLILTSWNN